MTMFIQDVTCIVRPVLMHACNTFRIDGIASTILTLHNFSGFVNVTVNDTSVWMCLTNGDLSEYEIFLDMLDSTSCMPSLQGKIICIKSDVLPHILLQLLQHLNNKLATTIATYMPLTAMEYYQLVMSQCTEQNVFQICTMTFWSMYWWFRYA